MSSVLMRSSGRNNVDFGLVIANSSMTNSCESGSSVFFRLCSKFTARGALKFFESRGVTTFSRSALFFSADFILPIYSISSRF